jgi:hypothetical protein
LAAACDFTSLAAVFQEYSKMKTFVIMLLLTTAAAASAQSNPPKIITYKDNATGEVIGKAVVNGNWIFLRNRHDEHYATIIMENGVRRWVDPSGNPIDPKTMKLPLE